MSEKRMKTRVMSQLGQDLADIMDEVKKTSEEQVHKAITSVSEKDKLEVLADPEIALTEQQKLYYIYTVQPQLENIYKLVKAGGTVDSISKALGVPIKAMYAIRKQIPEVEEMFKLGRQFKSEVAMESIYHMAQDRVMEEEVIDKFGDKHIIQKIVPAQFAAAKFIVEREGPEGYKKEDGVDIKIGVSTELKDMLKAMTVDDIKAALQKSEEVIVDAEFTEHE